MAQSMPGVAQSATLIKILCAVGPTDWSDEIVVQEPVW
jgi:hypothetical protein